MRYLIIFIFIVLCSCQRSEVSTYKDYLNHNDTVKYVGKEQCRMCHSDIYDTYTQTGMGKSFNYAIKEHSELKFSQMLIIYDSIKDLSYEPFWRHDSLYLKEFRLKGVDTVHILIKKVDYKIGSGHHTNSHLFEINGYVHQMPYTYYTQNDISDFPPGFEESGNSRFSREIGLECMSCHNAHSQIVTTSSNKYDAIPKGIDCENCHGPGEIHVKRKLSGEIIDTSKYIDYSIVNPRKLPLDLQFDICQRCHLQGTSILANDKSFNSFRPGMQLNEVMDTYLPRYENNNSFIMASHVDRLKQSSCFKNADITCVSCHNPHKTVTNLTANYFDNKCMQCHDVCKDEQVEDCASCHMPKSTTSDILHVSITDHKIDIQKEAFSNKRNFLGLFAINNHNSSHLSRAKAYLKRFESFEPISLYLDSAFYYLEKSENNFTSYIQYFYIMNDNQGLINYVMSNKIDEVKYSNSDLAIAYSRMGEVFGLNNIHKDANYFHKRAIDLMPLIIDYKIKYGSFFFQNNQLKKAQDQYLYVLKLNPTIKEAHVNLGLIAILEGNYKYAENSLKQAIALDPDYILAYENLVLLYEKTNNFENTKLYLEKILEIAPEHKAKQILENFN